MSEKTNFMAVRKKYQVVKDIKPELIHKNFFKNADEHPQDICVFSPDGKEYTYGFIAEKAKQLAKKINDICPDENEKIAVVLKRGVMQVIAVMAVLYSGHAYVPIGTHHPEERRNKVIEKANIKCIISETSLNLNHNNCNVIFADMISEFDEKLERNLDKTDTDSIAYIIFTSGSTGTPKGVAISHKAAWNTIFDINERYSVSKDDCAIAISALDFDLSVYDIFGLTSVGGKILEIDESISKEASEWTKLVSKYNVTIWNSVPALFEMFLVSKDAEDDKKTLRLSLISGDWIPLSLPETAHKLFPDIRFISLGGATECSIWSNYFEVEKDWQKKISSKENEWKSIPYGMPLTNQKFRVCDENGNDCDNNVAGELWIGGDGVAEGYYNETELTEKSFVNYDGEKWYKTGDYGCFHENGIIEFLGRKDNQVKVSGFRIELGEIDSIMETIDSINKSYSVVKKVGNSSHILTAVTAKSAVSNNLFDKVRLTPKNSINEEHQAEIIEKTILNIINNTEFAEQNQNTKSLWFKWLESRDVLLENYNHGSRYETVLNYKGDDLSEDEKQFMSNTIKSEKLISDIVSGKESQLKILEDDFLSPEKMSYRDSAIKLIIDEISDIIKKDYENNKKILKIAFIDGRTGSTIKKVIDKLIFKECEITYIENSMAILTEAKETFDNLDIPINYEYVSDYSVDNELLFKFDYVISINSFHRYKDVSKVLEKCQLLLNDNGKLMFVEQEKLMPVGYITAAVIENGFENLDEERKKVGDPMLSADVWKDYLFKLGYSNVKLTECENSKTFFIEAMYKSQDKRYCESEIKEKMSETVSDYMIPEYVKYFYDIPLSANGKIDRNKITSEFNVDKQFTEDDILKTETEKMVASIWKEILGVEKISRNSGFIEIGGDSLAATKFLTIIKNRKGIDISLQQMFENQLLFKIADLIDEKLEETDMEEGEI